MNCNGVILFSIKQIKKRYYLIDLIDFLDRYGYAKNNARAVACLSGGRRIRGYAQAAHALHRSQSSISYLVARLQEQVGVSLLVVEGRKAQLTDAGRTLLVHAGELLADAQNLEKLAASLAQGGNPSCGWSLIRRFPKNCWP
ncbi:LysR family transcriptional regulator [Neopusillimonas aromaticivorans]|uniref:LysR family transcriptional regulator n=1 Tax=Neopusillimonas aromaticivorans TaxID=2979868 RepID=UPI00259659D2|nr:LysR family transcriptional regulator [Neopusillimonas aromaticivorans]WJJ92732.1 LysR family transcriptional regulator [Neopusillimonas aromaticivorans]